jgi:hypothetical protein
MNLQQAAQEIERRLVSIFCRMLPGGGLVMGTIPVFARIPAGGSWHCSTNIFTAKPARALAQAIKRAGPRWLFEISKILRGPEIRNAPANGLLPRTTATVFGGHSRFSALPCNLRVHTIARIYD